jgi:hypothetical protein
LTFLQKAYKGFIRDLLEAIVDLTSANNDLFVLQSILTVCEMKTRQSRAASLGNDGVPAIPGCFERPGGV